MIGITDERTAYTKGGLDVVTAINLFFKGVLLFPVFLSAGFVGAIMIKYMVFHGVPTMNRPTEEQQEQLRTRDETIGQVPAVMLGASPAMQAEAGREDPQPEIIVSPSVYDLPPAPQLPNASKEESYLLQEEGGGGVVSSRLQEALDGVVPYRSR